MYGLTQWYNGIPNLPLGMAPVNAAPAVEPGAPVNMTVHRRDNVDNVFVLYVNGVSVAELPCTLPANCDVTHAVFNVRTLNPFTVVEHRIWW